MEVNPNYAMPSSTMNQNSNPNLSPNQIPPRKKSRAGVITIVIGIILIALIAGAYAFTRKAAVPMVNDSASVQLNDVPTQTAGTPAAVPANVITSSPMITGLTLVNMETFPVQYSARVSFNLAETCSTADSTISQSGNVFTIVITSSRPADAVCGQVIVPSQQTVSIPTTGLAAGTYTVKAGKYSKTFKIATDNSTTFTSNK